METYASHTHNHPYQMDGLQSLFLPPHGGDGEDEDLLEGGEGEGGKGRRRGRERGGERGEE